MGATVGADSNGKSVDVELNVVPFIDLMSCLTAFLLLSAVWSNYKQINIKPKGLGRDATQVVDEEPKENLSVLLTENEIWVGTSFGTPIRIGNEGNYDWAALFDELKRVKESPAFEARIDIELAAEDNVNYQNVMNAMDIAVDKEVGFRDIGFMDPQSLSVKFQE